MKDHPILMNTEMVKAVLDGRKSQTRRVVKPSVKDCTVGSYTGNKIEPVNVQPDGDPWTDIKCPYGQIGDLLYVRETWCVHEKYDATKPSELPESYHLSGGIIYLGDVISDLTADWWGKTRPSIFLPKRFTRIWLKIKDIRVERLQDISEDDAKAEGLKELSDSESYSPASYYFYKLWNSINGKPRKDGIDISWKANPYVWVVEFERIEK